jgi:hypothetical protein
VKLTKDELAKLRQEQTSRVLRGEAECLSPELLARAAIGDLDNAEREIVAAHLANCSDCVEEFRMIASLEDWAKQATDSTRAPSKETPSIIRLPVPGAMDGEDLQRSQDKKIVVRPIWRRRGAIGFRVIPYAMAASFLIMCVLLGLWAMSLRRENVRVNMQAERERIERESELAAANQTLDETRRKLEEAIGKPAGDAGGTKPNEIAELRQKIEELSRPQLNTSITDLETRGSVRGSATDTVKTIEVAPGTNFFTVILNVSGQPSFKNYLLDIQDRGGKMIWSGRGLRKSPYNTFTVTLTRGLLPAGSYHLKLYGASGNQKELIEDYAVRIEYK